MVVLKLKSSHWIVDENDNIVIGEGRMEILEHVENTGSINQAAKMMKMSYKAVWSKIKYTEKHLNAKIVHSDKKTGSRLTREGKALLEKYQLLKKECMTADDRIFISIFKPKPSFLNRDGAIKKKKTSPPFVSVVGNSGSGKTTFLEKLIPELIGRGLKIGTIKHDVHGFEMDKPGKDSWRHKHAGASGTLISSPYQIGMVMDVEYDHEPDELLSLFNGMDIILTEGYKRGDHPKMEIFRTEIINEPLCKNDKYLLALITDSDVDLDVPVFSSGAVEQVADFLIKHFNLACVIQ